MFTHKHYVPILKGKQGEFDAIEELSDVAKSQLTPVIEIPAIPWDFENDQPKNTIDDHLDSIGQKLRKAWDSKAPFFIDVGLINDGVRMADGSHPLAYIFRKARTQSLKLIPVTGFTRGLEYQKAVGAAIAKDKLGACVRLERDDFDPADLKNNLDKCLADLKLNQKNTDILIDFGEILPKQAGVITTAARTMIGSLPYLADWRTLSVAATAFPQTLSAVGSNSFDFLDRTEWNIWLQLLTKGQKPLPRMPTFGDYAIQHPDPSEIDPKIMRTSASIRYTAGDKWLILRGRETRRFGYPQFRALCADLLKRPQYCGEQHCLGDDYVKRCAQGDVGTGSLGTWRTVGTVHHLTRVTEMIAKLP